MTTIVTHHCDVCGAETDACAEHPTAEIISVATRSPGASTITGRTAITVSEMLGVPLRKHADPTEDAREVTAEEARRICAEDPRLIYVLDEEVAAAIEDGAIRALSAEASTAADWRQTALCDIALARHETCDDDGGLHVFAGRPMTRTEARVECALALADARAQS